MLKINVDVEGNVFTITPEGKLSKSDFAKLNTTMNDYVNELDRAPSLLISLSDFPHWENLAGLIAHAKFVRDHHKLIPKIAIVGDVAILSVLPALADHFVAAKIRHFSVNALDLANQWVRQTNDHPGAFQIIDGMPSDVIALDVKGIITSQDYQYMLTPLIEEKLKSHDKLKVLCVLGDDFESYSGGAIWDDARLGIMHYSEFSKVAIASDINWIRNCVKLFSPFIPAQIQVFHLTELADAKEWIKT